MSEPVPQRALCDEAGGGEARPLGSLEAQAYRGPARSIVGGASEYSHRQAARPNVGESRGVFLVRSLHEFCVWLRCLVCRFACLCVLPVAACALCLCARLLQSGSSRVFDTRVSSWSLRHDNSFTWANSEQLASSTRMCMPVLSLYMSALFMRPVLQDCGITACK